MTIKHLTPLIIMAAIPHIGQADLILYEGFDYSPGLANGDSLEGSNGGTGWSAGWFSGGGPADSFESTGLTYAGLPTVGGAGDADTNRGVANRTFDITGLTDDGDVQYLSLLFNFDGNLPTAGDNERFLFFADGSSDGGGLQFNRSNGAGTIETRMGGVNGGSTVSFDVSTTHLVVMEFTWSDTAGSDQLNVWLNPTIGGGAIGAADLSSTGNFSNEVGSLYARTSIVGYLFDEIRLGTELSSVIPEPSSFALLVGFVGFLVVGGRRQVKD